MADNEEKLNYNEDKSKLIAKDIWKEEIPAVIEEETTLVSGLNKIFQSLFNRIKKVRTTFLERKILTGNGLSGGGNLSTDRTLSVKRKDASINVENTGISVNRSNEYNTTTASEDVLLTQLGGKRLYNRTVANRNAINNNSDKIESLYKDVSDNFKWSKNVIGRRKLIIETPYSYEYYLEFDSKISINFAEILIGNFNDVREPQSSPLMRLKGLGEVEYVSRVYNNLSRGLISSVLKINKRFITKGSMLKF